MGTQTKLFRAVEAAFLAITADRPGRRYSVGLCQFIKQRRRPIKSRPVNLDWTGLGERNCKCMSTLVVPSDRPSIKRNREVREWAR